MAIIVDEEKKPTHIFAILAWLGFLIVAGAAVYYIFFAVPQVVAPPAIGSLSAIAPIASSSINPQTVVSSPAFQAILQGTTIPAPSSTGPVSVGRPNPFLSP
jgi:hypothetical protein